MNLTQKIQKIGLLLKISYHLDFNKPLDVVLRYVMAFLICFSYTFFSKSIAQNSMEVHGHTVNLTFFIISGIALVRFVSIPLSMFKKTIAELSIAGMTEWVQTTPTSIWELFFAKTVWTFLTAFSEFMSCIIFTSFFAKIPLGLFINFWFLTSLVLVFVAYCGLGMMVLALILSFRRGSALPPLISRLTFAFGGVFFPVALLPVPIQFFSNALPLTHALKVIRLCFVADTPALIEPYLILIAVTVLNFAAGFALAEWSLSYGRSNGYLQRQIVL